MLWLVYIDCIITAWRGVLYNKFEGFVKIARNTFLKMNMSIATFIDNFSEIFKSHLQTLQLFLNIFCVCVKEGEFGVLYWHY